MKDFLNFLTAARDFNIKIVDDDQTMNQLVDFFLDISLEDETDTDILEWLFGFNRVIWATVWLAKKDYNEIISSWYGREYIDQDQFISNIITPDKKQMIILELIKVKDKRNYKTIEELQNELDDAVNNEDYKNAAKLKKQIETRLKRKTKKTKKIKKHESKTNN
jgi:hypothetical protein